MITGARGVQPGDLFIGVLAWSGLFLLSWRGHSLQHLGPTDPLSRLLQTIGRRGARRLGLVLITQVHELVKYSAIPVGLAVCT